MSNRRSFIRNSTVLGLLGTCTGAIAINRVFVDNNKCVPDFNDDNVESENIVSELFSAIKSGDSKRIEKLLEKEPSVRFLQDEMGRSLVWLAAMYNHKELFGLLKGKDYKEDMFDMVALANTNAIYDIVKKDASILNITNRAGYTPLLAAAECGQGASVEALIGIGAWIDTRIKDGEDAAIHFALKYPDVDAVSWMVQPILGNGGNPNLALKDGTTPLHLAVSTGHLFSVKMLLRKRADVFAKNNKGTTPVDLAVNDEIKQFLSRVSDEKKDWYITRYQARNGSNITTEDTYSLPYILINDFVTNAHFNPEMTKKLLKQIPDLLYARASWDEIAVEGCTHLGNEPLASFLLDAGSPLSVCTAIMFGFAQQVKDMINKNPLTINDKGPHDFPLIWYTAIGKQKIDIAEYLINKGVDVNANIRGRSALSECARRGHAELTELLIQKGADYNMVSVSSFFPGSPMQIAKARKQDQVIAVLKKYGAKE